MLLDGENKTVNNALSAIIVVFILPAMMLAEVYKTDLYGLKNGYWNAKHLKR